VVILDFAEPQFTVAQSLFEKQTFRLPDVEKV